MPPSQSANRSLPLGQERDFSMQRQSRLWRYFCGQRRAQRTPPIAKTPQSTRQIHGHATEFDPYELGGGRCRDRTYDPLIKSSRPAETWNEINKIIKGLLTVPQDYCLSKRLRAQLQHRERWSGIRRSFHSLWRPILRCACSDRFASASPRARCLDDQPRDVAPIGSRVSPRTASDCMTAD